MQIFVLTGRVDFDVEMGSCITDNLRSMHKWMTNQYVYIRLLDCEQKPVIKE